MKIYLDTCCLNRLSDRQIQERIRQETEAVNIMLSNFRTKRWHWIASSILQFEINQNPDLDQRVSLTTLLQLGYQTIFVGGEEILRGEELEGLGFKELDALHIACAESGNADILLTTDDRMLRRAKRYRAQLRVRVENPYIWLQEIN
ncbi:type II toxin-antitoxin system VapC family toxin [Candidatus Poribacteria bacterium]|nr:PIN domain-containing protein [Candidatus Poribacteria bacterium]MYH79252.1 type II toxin-antitoxin system VapC family toxin [Candidatus Poribacteria bacterium]MYK92835.1 type II toxin-antitoxin system VapC family toxin [Candidatus Poribacteria bacterium]